MLKSNWGTTASGEQVILYTLGDPSIFSVTVMNFGAHITSIMAPDKAGKMADIALGFSNAAEYAKGEGCLGSCIAPNGNRIGNATFTLNGATYSLDQNDGSHNLHSGFSGLHLQMWETESTTDNSVTFLYNKKDGECGFPGNCAIRMTYTVEGTSLKLDYSCTSDADTVFSPTNHSYFNLGGHNSGKIYDHVVWIDAKQFTATDAELIATGELIDVTGTPNDFSTPRTIGERINDDYPSTHNAGGGYDINYVVADGIHELSLVGYVEHPASGRHMDILTDLPGLQMYTSNGLKPSGADKDGATYGMHDAVCFETQFPPNAVNIPSFPQPILKAGEEFKTTTIYKFSTI